MFPSRQAIMPMSCLGCPRFRTVVPDRRPAFALGSISQGPPHGGLCCVACRSYCRQEPEIQKAVKFLDEQEEAGWTLIQRLLSGEQSVAELLTSPVLQVG